MKHAHLRHLRCTRPAYGTREHFDDDDYADADGFYARRQLEKFNRASHSDALPEMQILPFAEHVQADPVKIIRSIERTEIIGIACIFLALGFVAGALFAIGGD